MNEASDTSALSAFLIAMSGISMGIIFSSAVLFSLYKAALYFCGL